MIYKKGQQVGGCNSKYDAHGLYRDEQIVYGDGKNKGMCEVNGIRKDTGLCDENIRKAWARFGCTGSWKLSEERDHECDAKAEKKKTNGAREKKGINPVNGRSPCVK